MEYDVTVNVRGVNIPINLLELRDRFIAKGGKLSELMTNLDEVSMDELLEESKDVYENYLREVYDNSLKEIYDSKRA